MGLFGNPKKQPKRRSGLRKRRTTDQILDLALQKELHNNPELMKKAAFRKFGYDDLLAENEDGTDKIKVLQNRVKEVALDKALKRLEEEGEMSEAFIAHQFAELMGTSGRRRRSADEDEGEVDDGQTPAQSLIGQIRELKEIEAELGGGEGGNGKGGVLGGLITDKVIIEALKMLQARSAGGAARPADPLYVVQVDGQQKAVTAEEYRALAGAGRLMPVAAITAPKPAPQSPSSASTAPSPPPVAGEQGAGQPVATRPVSEASLSAAPPMPLPPEVAADAPLPGELNELDFEEVAVLLSKTPQEVVDTLCLDQRGLLLLAVLGATTYEKIVQTLAPYRNHIKVGRYVQRVIDPQRKPWAEELLKIVKELGYGGEVASDVSQIPA